MRYCNRNPESTKKFLKEVNEKAHDWFVETHFPIHEKVGEEKKKLYSRIIVGYFLLTSLVSMIISVIFLGKNFFFWVFLLPFSIFFIIVYVSAFRYLSRVISKKTPEATLEVKRWMTFKKFISDFSAMKDAPSSLLYIWDEYLVYAIVLNVAERLLKNIERLSLETNQPIYAPSWYSGTASTPSGIISAESMSTFINSHFHK